MKREFLEIAQMLSKHPILEENNAYKSKYISVLEFFVQKYSSNDLWSQAALRLYINKLVDGDYNSQGESYDLLRQAKAVIATKFRRFKFFTYRYCLIFDCILLCAYRDQTKGEKIFEELSTIYAKRYRNKLRQAFEFLYNPAVPVDGIDMIQSMKECWIKNMSFADSSPIRVLVTANMSAGKSTLLNALVGKKVNKTQNDTCTAKVHYIVNKPFEDGFYYEWDYLLELDADYQTLMEDNGDNESTEITVGTHFRTVHEVPKRLWLIDTPGVNSSQDRGHKQIAEETIRSVKADMLIYLLNGENIVTDDDQKHLLFILENYHGRILFVVNKVDRFRKKEDSISETLKAVVQYLTNIGFQEPQVVPVSAYAGFLAKINIFGERLNEDEQDELKQMSRKLQKEEYNFDTYYPEDTQRAIQFETADQSRQLLLHSGILQLENIIYNLGG